MNLERLGIWYLINVASYLVTLLSFKPVYLNECFANALSKILVLKGNIFQIDHVEKSGVDYANNIVYMVKMVFIQYYLCGLEEREINTLIILCSSILFGVVQQIRGMQTSCSCHAHWSKFAIAFYSISFVTTLVGLIYESQFVEEGVIKQYGIVCLTILIVYCLMYLTILHGSIVHLHHWYIGYSVTLLFAYDEYWTNVYFAVFHGIFIQGSVAYGLANIFQN